MHYKSANVHLVSPIRYLQPKLSDKDVVKKTSGGAGGEMPGSSGNFKRPLYAAMPTVTIQLLNLGMEKPEEIVSDNAVLIFLSYM